MVNSRRNINALYKEAESFLQQGDLESSESLLLKINSIDPANSEAKHLLGVIACQRGNYESAVNLITAAIEKQPGRSLYYYSLGIVFRSCGNIKDAVAAYKQAISIEPDFPGALENLGNAFREIGLVEEAEAALKKALDLKPNNPFLFYNYANSLKDLGRYDEALTAFERALQLKHDFAEAHNNFGKLSQDLGHLDNAVEAFKQSIKFNPDNIEAYISLGNILSVLGRLDDAESICRLALKRNPDHAGIHSNLLFMLVARSRLDADQILKEHCKWDQRHGQAGRRNRFPARIVSVKSGRLKVGYVSPDFRIHPVGFFFEPLLHAHNESEFEVFCYDASGKSADSATERMRGFAEHWRYIDELSDHDLAKLIHEDEIDILVDLAGHTANNRLAAFTYRPAPVQISYLGYFATTGLESIDYWITDEVLHPVNTPEKSVEKIYRLSRCWVSYKPPVDLPLVERKTSSGSQIVFGSFHHLSKLTSESIGAWGKILKELPGSRLFIMFKPLGDEKVKESLVKRFARVGIGNDRLTIKMTATLDEYFSSYAKVDIVLDAFPRTGGTTTIDALWMGVPVVTLAGKSYVERISASKLSAIGLEELIADSREDYINIALSLARNVKRRTWLHKNLREIVARSSLSDSQGLAKEIEVAYLAMWKQYLSTL